MLMGDCRTTKVPLVGTVGRRNAGEANPIVIASILHPPELTPPAAA